MRHIIVEGPDGGGKSTLVEKLSDALQMPVHEKASDSIKGPVDWLGRWVDADMRSMREVGHEYPAVIYDRHPVISEPIYAAHVRKQPPQYPFGVPEFITGVTEVLYEHAVLVWCIPDLETVSKNVFANHSEQMRGVPANIGKVHQAYMTAYFRWRGPRQHYVYNRHDFSWIVGQIAKKAEIE